MTAPAGIRGETRQAPVPPPVAAWTLTAGSAPCAAAAGPVPLPALTRDARPVPRRLRPWWPPLASLLLHAAALGAVVWLLEAESPRDPEPESGVEMVWQEEGDEALASTAPATPPAVPQPVAPEVPPSPPVAAAPPPVPPVPRPPEPRPAAAPPPPSPVETAQTAPPSPLAALLPPAVPQAQAFLPPPPPAAETPPEPVPERQPAPPEPVAERQEPPPEPEPSQQAQAERSEGEPLPLPPPLPPPAPPRQTPPQPPRPQMAAPSPPGPPAGTTEREAGSAGASRATGAVSPPGMLDGHRNAQPDYPLASRQRGEEGVVGLVLRIGPDGKVAGAEVGRSSGFPALDDSARRTAMLWRFRPAQRDGVPVEGTIRTAVHFRLQR